MQVGGSLADDSTQSRSKLFSFGHLVHPRAASCWVGPCPVRCLYHYLQVTPYEFPEPQDSASGNRLPANGICCITFWTLLTSQIIVFLVQLTAHLSNFAQNCQELQTPRWQVDPKKREAASVGRTSYSVRRTGQSAGFQAATNADEQIKKGWPLAAIVLKHLEFGISKCVWLSWDTPECLGLA